VLLGVWEFSFDTYRILQRTARSRTNPIADWLASLSANYALVFLNQQLLKSKSPA
jgi:hypothetical protein